MKRKKKNRSTSPDVEYVMTEGLLLNLTYTDHAVAWIVLLTGLDLIDEEVSRAMAAKMGIY